MEFSDCFVLCLVIILVPIAVCDIFQLGPEREIDIRR
jgi:hypothetical protein